MGRGRPKGAKGKLKQAIEICEDSGISPLKELIKLLKDEKATLNNRIDILKSILPYIHPKLKDVEISNIEVPNLPDIIIKSE